MAKKKKANAGLMSIRKTKKHYKKRGPAGLFRSAVHVKTEISKLRRRSARLRKAKAAKANPPKLKKVLKSSGWISADAVRFVKRRGRPVEVYIRRTKRRRRT